MIKKLRLIIFCSVHFFMVHAVDENSCASREWTWMHVKKYTPKVRVANASKKELIFKKEDVSPFTQLIVSWNVLRPEKGHFSFFVQVRDAETKEWNDWHLMADWGKGIQKTYATESNGLSCYVHVRLEIDAKKTADAFCIKVVPHEGAHLGLLYGLAASVSHFAFFKPEPSGPVTQHLKSVRLLEMPAIAQFALDHIDKSRICSPTSCAMVVEYLMGVAVNMNDFVAAVFDDGLSVYGSWQCNVAQAFDECKGKTYFFVRRANSFIDVYHCLERKMPVVVSVRGELPGALKPFPHGHLLVIIGWDKEAGEVLCHDPAAESNDTVFKRYALEPFLRAWERSHRLMYIVGI